jgi:alkylation response protein AidB-like acyl-CoA dehydrogenase
MDFSLSEEQTQLKDTIHRFVEKDYPFDARHKRINAGVLCDAATWQGLADLGVLALAVPEAAGGFNGGGVENMLIMEAFGKGLVVEPYLASQILGVGAVKLAADVAQQAALLESVTTGECKLAFAHSEPAQRYERAATGATAVAAGAGFHLTGQKVVVIGGAVADRFIVSAQCAGVTNLFVVDAKASGLAVHAYPTQDGSCGADIVLSNTPATRLGDASDKQAVIDQVLDMGCAGLCAEALGAMSMLLQLTTEYLKTRKQFGVTLSNFQVLKHRAVDMMVQIELSRSMVLLAATEADNPNAAVRSQKISAAKTLVGQAARFVSQQAVQTHGGIGVTDELNVSHYFKRLTMINASLGDADWHLARYSDHMKTFSS